MIEGAEVREEVPAAAPEEEHSQEAGHNRETEHSPETEHSLEAEPPVLQEVMVREDN